MSSSAPQSGTAQSGRPSVLTESGGAVAAAAAAPGRRIEPPPRDELERVRMRDREALGRFFDRYFDQVFGLALRLLGDRTAAEDVTQEVFFKVHRAAHTIDPARDPGPWLATIAANACRDVWRSGAYRLARRSASLDDDPQLADTLGTRADDPERGAIVRERERAVQDAILALPEPLRLSVMLHDYQGLSHQEIADLLGVEHAAARKRYSRALRALARRLKGALA